jgi:hypothetical protein
MRFDGEPAARSRLTGSNPAADLALLPAGKGDSLGQFWILGNSRLKGPAPTDYNSNCPAEWALSGGSVSHQRSAGTPSRANAQVIDDFS